MVTKTVAAHQLRAGWIVLPENGQPRRVALARCQGSPSPRRRPLGRHRRTIGVRRNRARHRRGQPMINITRTPAQLAEHGYPRPLYPWPEA